jgi:hypothetical protein
MTTLKPFLSVNPLKGFHQNYDALPDGPHGSVYLRTYGGHTEHSKGVGNPGGNDLESQAANDEILLGFDPVDLILTVRFASLTYWDLMRFRGLDIYLL